MDTLYSVNRRDMDTLYSFLHGKDMMYAVL